MTRPGRKHLAKAIETFKEIQKEHAKRKKATREKYTSIYRQLKKDQKPPEEFEGSSYLFMRSYDTDLGNRPFSNIVFWVSPDLKVAPATDPTGYTRDLVTGHRYTITANLRNRGDLNVPSGKIEFYLCNPTLGFDTRFADLLGVNTLWVPPVSSKQSALNHTFTATQSGHKCLFARAFSFSPLDIPVDPYNLNPKIDRHIAQLNLNIVNQGSRFMFQSIHLPNVMETIILRPVSERILLSECNYLFKDFNFNAKIPITKFTSTPRIRFKGNHQELTLSVKRGRILIRGESKDNFSLKDQKQFYAHFNRYLKMREKGHIPKNEKEIIQNLRAINKTAIKTDYELFLPDMGLKENEIAAFDIIRKNEISGMIDGGIRVIMTG